MFYKKKKHGIYFIENLKARRNFVARRDFRTCTKEQKSKKALTDMFCDFYIVYLLMNFSFVTSYNDGLLPDPRASKNQRTPSLIQGSLKCMVPIACICFMKYKSFQHFILPELC